MGHQGQFRLRLRPFCARGLKLVGSLCALGNTFIKQTKQLLSSTIGHVDFVKAIHVLPALRTLATGSSDRDLRLWDLSVFDNWDWTAVDAAASAAVKSSSTSAAVVNGEEDVSKEGSAPQTEPAPRVGAAPPSARPHAPLPLLSILKGHTRPVERLVSYAITEESAGRDQIGAPTGSWALVSADSMGAMKTWELKRSEMSGEEESKDLVNAKLSCEWRPHEIGVYDINLNPEEGEMWTGELAHGSPVLCYRPDHKGILSNPSALVTVSADSSLLLSRFSSSTPSIAPKPSLRIAHPSALKAVLYLPELNFVLTGAADEAIRAFDLASSDLDLDPSSSITTTVAVQWNGLPVAPDSALPGLVSRVEGHSHEVTDLHAYVVGQQSNSNRTAGSLSTTSQRREQVWVVSASVDGTIRRWSWSDILNPPPPPTLEEGGVDDDTEHKGLMTAEEEAELEALMVDH